MFDSSRLVYLASQSSYHKTVTIFVYPWLKHILWLFQNTFSFFSHILGVENLDNFHGKALGDKGRAAVEILKKTITSNGPNGLGPQPVVDDNVTTIDLSDVKLSSPPSYTIGERVWRLKSTIYYCMQSALTDDMSNNQWAKYAWVILGR